MISIDPKRTFDWIPPSEEGKENPATLILRPMTVRERQAVYPKLNAASVQAVSDTVWAILEQNVVGWRNVKDAQGADLAFEVGLLDHLSDDLAVGAYERILELSTMRAEEAGNS